MSAFFLLAFSIPPSGVVADVVVVESAVIADVVVSPRNVARPPGPQIPVSGTGLDDSRNDAVRVSFVRDDP